MAINTVMERIQQLNYGVPADDRPNKITRYFGGHLRKNHPYVNGYWYLVMNIPQVIFNRAGSSEFLTTSQIWLHSTCESFTPPTKTIRKEDIPGIGGLGSSYVTGQDLSRSFSITFREYQHLPIKKIFDVWTGVMDPHHGLSPLNGKEWLSSSYKGNCFVLLCKPTGAAMFAESMGSGPALEDIEEVYFFEGVFPETDPHDGLNSDINSTATITHSINFSFDGFPLNTEIPGVAEAAIEALTNSFGNRYHDINDIATNKGVYSKEESRTEKLVGS